MYICKFCIDAFESGHYFGIDCPTEHPFVADLGDANATVEAKNWVRSLSDSFPLPDFDGKAMAKGYVQKIEKRGKFSSEYFSRMPVKSEEGEQASVTRKMVSPAMVKAIVDALFMATWKQ